MSKAVKNMLVEDLEQRVGETQVFLVIDVSKMDANDANRFRLALREKEIQAVTVRNSLARRALSNRGVDGLDPVLEGPSTLVWGGEDIVSLSKEITKWAKEIDTLEVKGGTLDGESLDAAGVTAISKWPSREELLSIVAGQILSVASDIASQLTAPATEVAGQIKTLIERQEEGG